MAAVAVRTDFGVGSHKDSRDEFEMRPYQHIVRWAPQGVSAGADVDVCVFNLKYLFMWLCQLLVAALGIFSCSLWDLVPWPGIELALRALGAES